MHGQRGVSPARYLPGMPRYRRSLTDEQALQVLQAIADGQITTTKAAQNLQVSQTVINNLVRGRTYTDLPRPASLVRICTNPTSRNAPGCHQHRDTRMSPPLTTSQVNAPHHPVTHAADRSDTNMQIRTRWARNRGAGTSATRAPGLMTGPTTTRTRLPEIPREYPKGEARKCLGFNSRNTR
jgi:hypothetical protein